MSIFSHDRLHFWNDTLDATRAVRRIAYVGDEIYPNGVYLTVGATRPAAIWNRLGVCAGGNADNETFVDPRILQEHFKTVWDLYDMDIVSAHSDQYDTSMLFVVLERSSNYITLGLLDERNIERPHADSQQLGVGWHTDNKGVQIVDCSVLEGETPHFRKERVSVRATRFSSSDYHIGIATAMYAAYWRMDVKDIPIMSVRPAWRNTVLKLQA